MDLTAGSPESERQQPNTISQTGESSSSVHKSPAVDSARPTKLTPSCSRCRIKKLKCDRNQPCSHCVERGLESMCQKDVRLPRKARTLVLAPKRLSKLPLANASKKESREKASRDGKCKSEAEEEEEDSSLLASKEAEIARLRAQVAELEASSFRHSQSPSVLLTSTSPSSDGSVFKKRKFDSIAGSPAAAQHTSLSPEQAIEIAAQVIESYTATGRQKAIWQMGFKEATFHGSSHSQPGNHLSDYLGPTAALLPLSVNSSREIPAGERARHPYWSDGDLSPVARQERRQQKRELFRRIQASIPAPAVIAELMLVFRWRSPHLTGNAIFTPHAERDALLLCDSHLDTLIDSRLGRDPSFVALTLLALAVAWRFFPRNDAIRKMDPSVYALIQDVKYNKGDDTSLKWHALALECLAIHRTWNFTSLPALQAGVLLIVYSQDSPEFLNVVHRTCTQSAMDLQFNRLPLDPIEGSAQVPVAEREDHFLHRELAIRVWYHLVVRDWCLSSKSWTSMIHEDQMTSRRPWNVSSEEISAYLHDADASLPSFGAPIDYYNEMSYASVQIDLAYQVKATLELMNAQCRNGDYSMIWTDSNKLLIDAQWTIFIRDLPYFFKPDCEPMPGPILAQRWLIQQQIFDVLLKLHRSALGTSVGRASCLSLAHSILTSHKQAVMSCPVIEQFPIHNLHLLGAILVIIIDLLMSDQRQENREETLNCIREAYKSVKASDRASARTVTIIEALLAHEDRHAASLQSGPAFPRSLEEKRMEIYTLANQVVAEAAKAQDRSETNNNRGGRMLEISNITRATAPLLEMSWGPAVPSTSGLVPQPFMFDSNFNMVHGSPNKATQSVPDSLFEWLLTGEGLPIPTM